MKAPTNISSIEATKALPSDKQIIEAWQQFRDFPPGWICDFARAVLALRPLPSTDPEAETRIQENLLDYAMSIAHERELRVTGHRHDEDVAVRSFNAAVQRALVASHRYEGASAGAPSQGVGTGQGRS